MNNKAQISLEYILILSVIIILLSSVIGTAIIENEKNTILYAAQIGAKEGSNKNVYAIYYNDTFMEYKQNNPKLLTPTNIEIMEITINETGNHTIKIKTKAHTDKKLSYDEKNIISSRINYYIRKSITETFNQKTNDTYYNPAKSNRYTIETENIKWI